MNQTLKPIYFLSIMLLLSGGVFGLSREVEKTNNILDEVDTEVAAIYSSQGQVLGASTNGLVGYWNFNEGSGATVANSALSNNGTLVNNPAWVTGKVGGALEFDGTSGQSVNLGHDSSISGLQTFTISAWVKPSNAAGPALQIGWGSQVYKSLNFSAFSVSSAGRVEALVKYSTTNARSISASGASASVLGQWDHWAVTFSDSGDKFPHIYKNGVEVGYSLQTAGVGTQTLEASNHDWTVGATPGSAFYKFAGGIDELRIYNRVLSATEIAEIYSDLSINSVSPPATVPPVTETPPVPPVDTTPPAPPAPPVSVDRISIQPANTSLGSPVLNFIDLTSGPSTGNTDISLGQVSGENGAIVTLWGKNLGSSQSNSKVYVDGYEARVYSWGNANTPADLYKMHGMQMVAFQIPKSASSGTTKIQLSINGRYSNTLDFTVRSGKIYFVDVNGSDTGSGSWASPWQTILRCIHTTKTQTGIASGDICYIKNGVSQTEIDKYYKNYPTTINLDTSGTASAPKALVAYPGATVNIGNDSILRGLWGWPGSPHPLSSYWTISKLNIRGGSIAVEMFNGFRVVGNYITAPFGDGATGGIYGAGSDLVFIGNEVTNVGRYGASKLYHPIYISGARVIAPPRKPEESRRDISWNYIHDNYAYRGINIYSEGLNSAFISEHTVHDNVVMNQTGVGILLGSFMTGQTLVYNNLVINSGLGPQPSVGDGATFYAIEIDAGHADYPGGTDVYFYNNTVYGGPAFSGSHFSFHGLLHLTFSFAKVDRNLRLHLSNNVFYAVGGEKLLSTSSEKPPAGAYGNLWYGDTAPTWDITAIKADPQFVNPAGNDFRLKSNSPAINAGVDISSIVARDFDSVLRRQGNNVDIGAYEFTGTPSNPPSQTDTTKPIISTPIVSNITASGATITWTTDEVSDSQAEYGLTTNYGNSSSLNTSLITNHSVTLTGLSSNTTYSYRIKSRDASNNLTTSNNFTFSTLTSSSSTKKPKTIKLASLQGKTAIGTYPVATVQILSGSTVLKTFNLSADSSGNYSISFETTMPKNVSIRIKIPGYLSKVITNIDTETTSNTTTLSQFLAGDFNGDGIVNSLDFSVMNQKWNQGDALYDINGDGKINVLDYSILSGNWNRVGE